MHTSSIRGTINSAPRGLCLANAPAQGRPCRQTKLSDYGFSPVEESLAQ
jgi:hypothetical protein